MGQATPPELPPGLREEYLVGVRAQLGVLAAIAERLAKRGDDREALDALRREAHKLHGSAGSYGFPQASRLAAGMEATVKDWLTRPTRSDMDHGALARWFVRRLAEMFRLEVRAPATAPPAPQRAVPRPAAPPPRVAPPLRPVKPAAPPAPPSAPAPRSVPPAPRPTRPEPPPPPRKDPAPASAPKAARPAPTDAPELICVEDDSALAELLEYGLRARGYRFRSYRNGREALRDLAALDVGGTHPLVLLDVDLPGLDGYSIFDALQRERPGVYRVVFTTVHGSEAEQLRGLEAGALDYLVKPISLRVALEKIRRWVGR